MFNLLSAEWYKFKKSKSFLVCTLIAIAVAWLLYGTLQLAENQESFGTANNGVTVAYVAEPGVDNSEIQNISILDVVQQMLCGFTSIMTCIFVCIFVIAEYGNGAIKNIAEKGYSRKKVFLAKFVAAILAAMLMTIVIVEATVILGVFFRGTGDLNPSFFRSLFAYTGIQLMLGMAYTGIVVTICEISRSMGIGISVSLAVASCSTLLSGALDMALHRWNVKASDYWIMDLMTNCPLTNIDGTFVRHAVIASVLWLVIAFVIGIVHFQKRDIK